MMLKFGVTGGIGAGKSIVCQVFEHLGAPVFNADLEAKKLLTTTKVKDFYRKTFGDTVFSDIEIDKAKLAAVIFNNNEALQRVNAFIHPLVFNIYNEWCLLHKNSPYVIKEAALLFESKAYLNLDYTILVQAPLNIRLQRVMSRDSTNKDAVLARMNNQMDDDQKAKLASFIIQNNGESLMLSLLLEIHNNLINKIKI